MMLDRYDLEQLEAALDELEELHDEWIGAGEPAVRTCQCATAARWRRAAVVTIGLRQHLNLAPRLKDLATQAALRGR